MFKNKPVVSKKTGLPDELKKNLNFIIELFVTY